MVDELYAFLATVGPKPRDQEDLKPIVECLWANRVRSREDMVGLTMSMLTKDVPPYAGQQSFIVRATAAAAGTRALVATEEVKRSRGLGAAPSRGAKRAKDWRDMEEWSSKKHKGVCFVGPARACFAVDARALAGSASPVCSQRVERGHFARNGPKPPKPAVHKGPPQIS